MPHWGGPHGDRGPRSGHRHPGHGPHGMPFWGPRFAGPARLRLLEALSAASHPLSVSEIAEAIGVDQPRASRLVADAAMRGLVERNPDPADARRIRVAITSAGRALLDSMRDSRRSAVQAALADFTPAERETFAAQLARFVDAWPS